MTIATTRPETMLGDTAVAVHPDPAAALDAGRGRACRRGWPPPRRRRSRDLQAELDDVRAAPREHAAASCSSSATWPWPAAR